MEFLASHKPILQGPIALEVKLTTRRGSLFTGPSGYPLTLRAKSMTNLQVSGIEPGQRRLNGTQTTGREYRNLSQPTHGMAHDDEAAVPMRNGVMLLADVYRPAEPDLWKPTPGRRPETAWRSITCRWPSAVFVLQFSPSK